MVDHISRSWDTAELSSISMISIKISFDIDIDTENEISVLFLIF